MLHLLLYFLFHSSKKLISFGSLVCWNLKYLKFLQHDLLFMLILHGIQCKIAIELVLFCLVLKLYILHETLPLASLVWKRILVYD